MLKQGDTVRIRLPLSSSVYHLYHDKTATIEDVRYDSGFADFRVCIDHDPNARIWLNAFELTLINPVPAEPDEDPKKEPEKTHFTIEFSRDEYVSLIVCLLESESDTSLDLLKKVVNGTVTGA
jgi:hypothetical protein